MHNLTSHRKPIAVGLVLFWVSLATASTASAQLPGTRLDGLFPLGGGGGSVVEVGITGIDLDDVDRLVFSHDGITSTRKMGEETPFDEGPQPIENRFLLTIANNVPAGNYEVRCQGKYGLSNPRTFVVGTLPEVIEVEPNGGHELPAWSEVDDGMGGKKRENAANEITVPSTVNGASTNGADVDWYRFTGTAGQRLLVEGFSRRIDSRMQLVITLYHSNGSVLGESRVGTHGDPLVDVTLPANGEYFLKVHDALYRQGGEYGYRFTVGVLPYLDFVFPPAAAPGSNEEFTLYGRNLPGGQPSEYTIDGHRIEKLTVRIPVPGDVVDRLRFSSRVDPHVSCIDGIEYRVQSGNVRSNPILIAAAMAPVVREVGNNDRPETAQKLSPPCEVAGQFYPQRDVDWFTFDAKAEEEWVVDLRSDRLGATTDPSLLLQRVTINEMGEKKVEDVLYLDDLNEQNFNNRAGRHEFDTQSRDPRFLIKVPADGTYRVLVKDGVSSVRSDPRLVYQLSIRKPAPDFRVIAVPGESTGTLLLRKGGRDVVRVFVERIDGYDGEIRVSATGLPRGVTTDEIIVGPANTMGTLILTAAEDAPMSASTLQVSAKGLVGGKETTRTARYGAALQPFQFNQPNSNTPSVPARLVERIQVCVSEAELAPQLLTIGDGTVIETSRGGVIKIPYTLKKREGAAGSLTGFPIDFSPQTNVQQVGIGGNEKGEFEMRFQANTPPGTFSFYLAGFNQGYQYKRNPEAAAKAKERQERVGKVLMESQLRTQEAQKTVQTKQTELQAAINLFNQSNTQKTQAEQGATNADAAHQQALAALKQKQEQAAAAPTDDGLKTQVTQAQTAVEEAVKKLKDAQTTAADAVKKQEEAMQAQVVATEAKTAADAELQAAQQFQQQAQQEKQRADQYANQKQNEANPRGINMHVPSNSLTIKLVEFPLKVDALPEAVSVKQGEKVEVVVKVSRMYGFTSGVNIQTQIPGGVGGLGIQNINIGDNQPEGKFEVNAQPTGTVGEHLCTVRLQMNFNGQNLVMERPLKITVIEVKPPTN